MPSYSMNEPRGLKARAFVHVESFGGRVEGEAL